jgi:hypothetical protein
MDLREADVMLRKLDATWALREPRSDDEKNEWLEFLLQYEFDPMKRAVEDLRVRLRFRPSMAEIRTAYTEAGEGRDDRALPPAQEDGRGSDLSALYGENQRAWVYCWRCDMVLSLEERDSLKLVGYDGERGLYHHRCPRKGSAPTIPHAQRTQRDEYFARKRIGSGPNVTPRPYRGQG